MSRQNTGVITQRFLAAQRRSNPKIMVAITKQLLAVAMVLGLGMALSACETAEGFGRDMEKLGKTIQDSASQ